VFQPKKLNQRWSGRSGFSCILLFISILLFFCDPEFRLDYVLTCPIRVRSGAGPERALPLLQCVADARDCRQPPQIYRHVEEIDVPLLFGDAAYVLRRMGAGVALDDVGMLGQPR